jgi:hypothetical protein
MLDKTFEWERLVHPDPTDGMVAIRKAIVTSILSSFDSAKGVNEAIQIVSAAITGLNPSIQADVAFAATLTEVTKKHHQAFPSSLNENALDLQLSASLAVGEVLTRKPSTGAWGGSIDLIAGLTISASQLQPTAAGIHLKAVQDTLVARANEHLSSQAIQARVRPEYDSEPFKELTAPGDLPTFWNQLKLVLENVLESIATASSIDRDELEVLWWLYNDTSATFSKNLSDLTAFDVALASSLELVDRALCPAPASLKIIIHGLVARANKKAKPPSKTLKAIVGGWSPDIFATFSPQDDDVRAVAVACPKVLPLTWIASKITQSGVITGWEQEFEARTGLSASRKLAPEAIAEQVFAERTAQRLLLPFCGE